MNEDRIIRLDDYRPQRPPAERHTLRSLFDALWPSALVLAALYAGERLIGGLVQHIASALISLAMIAWSIAGYLRPRAEDWLDPVLDAPVIAANIRKTRYWSIVSLLLWTAVAGYATFSLVQWEMAA
ncbi:MAG: hypothetical protein J7494_11285 [Sphingobium sp.]|nr:hypothetical protein [Sphingobium sp.]